MSIRNRKSGQPSQIAERPSPPKSMGRPPDPQPRRSRVTAMIGDDTLKAIDALRKPWNRSRSAEIDLRLRKSIEEEIL